MALVVSDQVKSSKIIAHGLNNIKKEPVEVIVLIVLYGNIITTRPEALSVSVTYRYIGTVTVNLEAKFTD